MRKYLLSFVAISLLAQPVLAVDVELYKAPKGIQIEIDGGRLQAFTFSEWKQILIIDQELKSKTAILKEFSTIRKELESENGKLSDKIISHLRDAVTLRAENDRLTKQWQDCDKELQKRKAGGLFKHIFLLAGGTLAIVGGVALLVD
jgi:hypothetical protein